MSRVSHPNVAYICFNKSFLDIDIYIFFGVKSLLFFYSRLFLSILLDVLFLGCFYHQKRFYLLDKPYHLLNLPFYYLCVTSAQTFVVELFIFISGVLSVPLIFHRVVNHLHALSSVPISSENRIAETISPSILIIPNF